MNETKVPVLRKRSSPIDEASRQTAKSHIIFILLQTLQSMIKDTSALKITIVEGPTTTIFELDFAAIDFGRIVGSKGRTIDALRVLVGAMAAAHDFRAIVRIKDEERFF